MESEDHTHQERVHAPPEQLGEEIRCRLCSTGHPALRQVICDYRDGVIVLSGRVPRYYHKQLAQSTLLDVSAMLDVVNRIEVAENGPHDGDLH